MRTSDLILLGALGFGGIWLVKHLQLPNPVGDFFNGVGTGVHNTLVNTAQPAGSGGGACPSYPCVVYQMHDGGGCWKDTIDAAGNLLASEQQNILDCVNSGYPNYTT